MDGGGCIYMKVGFSTHRVRPELVAEAEYGACSDFEGYEASGHRAVWDPQL